MGFLGGFLLGQLVVALAWLVIRCYPLIALVNLVLAVGLGSTSPVPWLLAGAGVGWWLIRRRSRSRRAARAFAAQDQQMRRRARRDAEAAAWYWQQHGWPAGGPGRV